MLNGGGLFIKWTFYLLNLSKILFCSKKNYETFLNMKFRLNFTVKIIHNSKICFSSNFQLILYSLLRFGFVFSNMNSIGSSWIMVLLLNGILSILGIRIDRDQPQIDFFMKGNKSLLKKIRFVSALDLNKW